MNLHMQNHEKTSQFPSGDEFLQRGSMINACQRSFQWIVAVHLLEKMQQQRLQGEAGWFQGQPGKFPWKKTWENGGLMVV